MSTNTSFLQKYGSTPPPSTKQNATTQPKQYPCGNCGSTSNYRLISSLMWECRKCQALYPYIARLESSRTIETIKWLKPCPTCSTPWLIRSKKGGFICPNCQDIPIKDWLTLVCCGSNR